MSGAIFGYWLANVYVTNTTINNQLNTVKAPPGNVAIRTQADFMAMARSNKVESYYLANDLVLNNYDLQWNGIFRGQFDGNGYTISGTTSEGLFSSVRGDAVFKNIKISNFRTGLGIIAMDVLPTNKVVLDGIYVDGLQNPYGMEMFSIIGDGYKNIEFRNISVKVSEATGAVNFINSYTGALNEHVSIENADIDINLRSNVYGSGQGLIADYYYLTGNSQLTVRNFNISYTGNGKLLGIHPFFGSVSGTGKIRYNLIAVGINAEFNIPNEDFFKGNSAVMAEDLMHIAFVNPVFNFRDLGNTGGNDKYVLNSDVDIIITRLDTTNKWNMFNLRFPNERWNKFSNRLPSLKVNF